MQHLIGGLISISVSAEGSVPRCLHGQRLTWFASKISYARTSSDNGYEDFLFLSSFRFRIDHSPAQFTRAILEPGLR
jgi:hypothetical protein